MFYYLFINKLITGFEAPMLLIDGSLNVPQSKKIDSEIFLSILLPYDPFVKTGTRFDAGLKEFKWLLVALESMITAFNKKDLKHFDPLVGENACQIRAVKMAKIIANNAVDLTVLETKLKEAKSKLDALMLNLHKINKKEVSLGYYLKNQGFDFQLSGDEVFLLISYILTQTKVSFPFKAEMPLLKNEKTVETKIKEILDVGSLFAKNFIAHLRKLLALQTVRFVQESSVNLQDRAMFASDTFIKKHNGLDCLPCFWATTAAMKEALSSNIPIIMVVHQRFIDQNYKTHRKDFFVFEIVDGRYRLSNVESIPLNSPAIYLLGSLCLNSFDCQDSEQIKKRFESICPVEAVMSYAAVHRQYPNPSLDESLVNHDISDLQIYQAKAHELGYSMTNPKSFFLAHAFCDVLSNINLNVDLDL